MTFRVRAFNQQGQPTEVVDPFLRSLNEQQAPPIQGPAIIPPRFQPGPKGPFYTPPEIPLPQPQQGPAIIPDADFLYANRAQDELLRPFFEDQAERAGLGRGVENLDAQIERLSQGLRQGSNGLSGSERGILRALESGGTESADAYFAGIQQRRGQREQLTGQRDELLATLDALDRDGTSPTQALRDFIDETPGFPDINPETESPEDVFEIFSQAIEARLADTPEDEVYKSGHSGQVGENIDRFFNLRNQGKIEIGPRGAEFQVSEFEDINDYTDALTLDLRIFPGKVRMSQAVVEQALDEMDPNFSQRYETQGEADTARSLMIATVLDRLENDQSFSEQDALGDWLAVQFEYSGGRVNE